MDRTRNRSQTLSCTIAAAAAVLASTANALAAPGPLAARDVRVHAARVASKVAKVAVGGVYLDRRVVRKGHAVWFAKLKVLSGLRPPFAAATAVGRQACR